MKARKGAAHYRALDEARERAEKTEVFKTFDSHIFGRVEFLKVWAICNLGGMTDTSLTYIAARVPPLFPAISAERRRRRDMESEP